MGASNKKINAIYELREAAEKKALAEKNLAERPTARKRDELLDAKLGLERKTLEAIEVCHECGHEHADGTPHIPTSRDNVVQMEDRRGEG
jgi:hypothetical protein